MTSALQILIDAISVGSLYALAALGVGLVFGVLRLVNFAYGRFHHRRKLRADRAVSLDNGDHVHWRLAMAAPGHCLSDHRHDRRADL